MTAVSGLPWTSTSRAIARGAFLFASLRAPAGRGERPVAGDRRVGTIDGLVKPAPPPGCHRCRKRAVGRLHRAEGHGLGAGREVAYAIGPAGDRGKGSAPRAAILLSRWALDVVGLERLGLFAHPESVASQRVFEKAGFHREGIARSVRVMHGSRVDLVRFSLVRRDPH